MVGAAPNQPHRDTAPHSVTASPTKHTRLSNEEIQSFIAIAKENGLHPYLNQKQSNAVKIKKEVPKVNKDERVD